MAAIPPGCQRSVLDDDKLYLVNTKLTHHDPNTNPIPSHGNLLEWQTFGMAGRHHAHVIKIISKIKQTVHGTNSSTISPT